MKTYPTKKLGEVCDLYQPKTISKAEMVSNGQFKVYGANGVIGRYNRYNHEQSEILVTCRGATCGTVNVSEPKSWINGNAMVVRPKSEEEISKEYLYYLLKGGIDISTTISGSAQPQITRTTLYPIKIPLPPISEQKKIVEKLERVLAKISEAKKLRVEARKNADNLLSAELHKIFEEGKKNYNLEELGKVAILVRGPFGGSLKKEIFVSAGDCVYEQGNVIDNDLENFRYYIIPEKFVEMKRFAVSAGDILMSCSGTIGRFVIIPSDLKKGIINQALLKITPNQKITAAFLKYALEDYLLLSNTHVKGMAIKNIAAVKELKKIKIPLPPLAEQKKIVARLDSLSEKIEKIKNLQSQTAADFKTLEQSVLSKAFSGNI